MGAPGFVGPLLEPDRCPLCGLDPLDPSLHADTCPTVTDDLCGVIEAGRMCMKSEHLPERSSDDGAWERWRTEHEWTALEELTTAVAASPGATTGGDE